MYPPEWPKKTDNTNVGKDVEQPELSNIVSRDIKWYSHFEKISGSFFENLTYASLVTLGVNF